MSNVDATKSEYSDAATGKVLDPNMVLKAWAEEIEYFKLHSVWMKVPRSECLKISSKQPPGTMLIHINKGYALNSNHRSMSVARATNTTADWTSMSRPRHETLSNNWSPCQHPN